MLIIEAKIMVSTGYESKPNGSRSGGGEGNREARGGGEDRRGICFSPEVLV